VLVRNTSGFARYSFHALHIMVDTPRIKTDGTVLMVSPPGEIRITDYSKFVYRTTNIKSITRNKIKSEST